MKICGVILSLDLAGFYLSTPVVLSHHVTDLLSHIALRLLKIIEPYLVEQERMATAQLLGYGSKHLEQNFFLFFFFFSVEVFMSTPWYSSTQ